MTGESIYLNENVLEIIERVQNEVEREYGFRPTASQAIEQLADGTKYDPGNSRRKQQIAP